MLLAAYGPNEHGIARDGPSHGHSHAWDRGERHREANHAPSPIAFAIELVQAPAANDRQDKSERRAEKRSEDDLEAQRRMAEAAENLVKISWWQFAIGIVTAALLGLTLWFTRKAVFAAIDSTEHAKTAHVLETRPYVVLDEFSFEQSFHEYTAKFVFKNVGKTPADIVKIAGALIYLRPDEALTPDDRRFQTLGDSGYPHILPADKIVPKTTLYLDEVELLKGVDTGGAQRQQMGGVVAILRVEYRATVGNVEPLWHTQAAYHLEFEWLQSVRMFRSTQIRSLTSVA